MKVVLCNTKEELLQKGLLELMLDCLTCLPGKTFALTHPRTIGSFFDQPTITAENPSEQSVNITGRYRKKS